MTSALAAALRSAAFLPAQSVDVLSVAGAESLDLLNRISTNALADLTPGQVRSTVFTTEKGRVVDAARALPVTGGVLLLASGGLGETLQTWISRFIIMEDVTVALVSESVHVEGLVGPAAFAAARECWSVELQGGGVAETHTAGGTSRTAATAEFGAEWVFRVSPQATRSAHAGQIPVLDPDSWTTLRVLLGVPAGGTEITGEFTPYDLGLTWMLSFTKGCYVGQEVIARLDTYGKTRRRPALVGFDGIIPADLSDRVLLREGGEAGVLTTIARLGERSIALAVISKNIPAGTLVRVAARDGMPPGRIMELPADPHLILPVAGS